MQFNGINPYGQNYGYGNQRAAKFRKEEPTDSTGTQKPQLCCNGPTTGGGPIVIKC